MVTGKGLIIEVKAILLVLHGLFFLSFFVLFFSSYLLFSFVGQ